MSKLFTGWCCMCLFASVSLSNSIGEVCSVNGNDPTWIANQLGFVFPLEERWTETATDPGPLLQGDPTTVTWGVVADGTFVPNFFGEPSADSDLRALLLDFHFGNESVWLPMIESAFDRWEELTGIDFVHEPNDDGEGISSGFPGILGVRPDIRIGGKFIDGNSGSIAFGLFPQTGDIVLDTADDFYDDLSNDDFPLRQVLMHEIGHALGIFHVCPKTQTKLMEPSYIDSFEGPQVDDVAAAHRGYGDAFEPNDSQKESFNLGNLSGDSAYAYRRLSIDDGDDLDYFSFSLASAADVTISTVPLGQVYESGEDDEDCVPGTFPLYNGVQVHNLVLELQDDAGTPLSTVDNGVAGDMEQIEMPLSAGTYTIFVRGSVVLDEMQLYGLWISVDDRQASELVPGTAGVLNSITLTNAKPNTSQFLVFSAGSSGVDLAEVPICGQVADLNDPIPVVSGTTDASGNLTLSLTPPASAVGRAGFFQIIEGGTCEATHPVTRTFQ